jgi:hypothetical protein
MAVRDMDVAAEVIGFRHHAHQAAGLRGQLLLLRRRRRAVCLHLSRHGRAGGFNLDLSFKILFMIIIGGVGSIMGSFLGAAFIVLLPIFLNVVVQDMFAGLGQPWPCLQPSADRLRRPDHLLPDRRAARPGPTVADRQGEAQPVAVPALASSESGLELLKERFTPTEQLDTHN